MDLKHFVYDPIISGFDTSFWKAITGAPSIVSNKLRLPSIGATKATQVLTLTGAITPGVHAATTLTSDTTAPADGAQVTIGSTVYTAKTALTGAAYEVLIGGSAAAFLANLKKAINLTGVAGTDYGIGTAAHPTVVGYTLTATTLLLVARVPGTAANSTVTTGATHLTFSAATLGAGTGGSVAGVAGETATVGATTYMFVTALSETAGAAAIANQVLFGANSAAALDNFLLAINGGATAGTNYSTGTAANASVTATTNTDTQQTVQAILGGTVGNSIATTAAIANGSWGAATLAGGTDNGTPGEITTYTFYRYGEFEFAVNVPTAPTAGDYRAWGLKTPSLGTTRSRAEFRIMDAVFSCVVYSKSGVALLNQAVAWNSDWTGAETKFAIRNTVSGVTFLINGTIVAKYTCADAGANVDRVDEPTPVHCVNGSATSNPTDNLDFGAFVLKNLQSIT